MKNFTATLNGVTYTDRKEFFNALRKTGNSQIKEISIQESEDSAKRTEKVTAKEEKEEKSENTKVNSKSFAYVSGKDNRKETPSNENNNKNLAEYLNAYCDLLGLTPEVKARISELADIFAAKVEKPAEKYSPVSARREQLQNEVKARAAFNRMVDAFIVSNPTFISFGANENLNDHRLDEMSSTLKTQQDKFAKEFAACSDVVSAQFRKKVESELEEIKHEIDKTDYDARLHELDEQIADLEQYFKICQTYNLSEEHKADMMYKNATNEWERLHTEWVANSSRAKRNFYKLLADYYNNLLEQIFDIRK